LRDVRLKELHGSMDVGRTAQYHELSVVLQWAFFSGGS
jgi:hypothetical protein